MQVETQNNMKSQVTGVRKSSEDAEENKSHKRLKLVHNSVETSSQHDIHNTGCTENTINEGNFDNIHVTSENNFPDKMFESDPICDLHINGSLNNGNRSGYDENLNNNVSNETLNIMEKNSFYENGYTADANPQDSHSILDSSNQTYYETQVSPQILDEHDNQNNHVALPTLETHTANENTKTKESSIPEQVSEPMSENSLGDEHVNKSSDVECLSFSGEELQNSTLSVSRENPELNVENSVQKELNLTSNQFNSDPCCSHTSIISEQTDETVNEIDVKYLGIYSLKATQLEGHSDKILSVAANEKIVLSSSCDTTIKVWDVENQMELNNFAGHSGAVTSVILLNPIQSKALAEIFQWSDVSSVALSGSLDCNIKVWSVSNGKELSSIYTFNSITCMEYLSTNLCLIGTDGGKLEVWNLSEKKKIESVFAHKSSVSELKVLDSHIFTASKDGTVRVWFFEEDELQPLYTRRRQETSKYGNNMGPSQWKSIAVSNDMIYLGDNTTFIKTLNWKLGRMRLYVNHVGDFGKCDAVIVKDDVLLSTSYGIESDNASINVWSLPEMTYVGTLAGDTREIFSLALIRIENRVRIVSGGHQLLVWDFNLKEPSSKNNSFEDFFFQEIEGLGVEITEKPKEIIHPIRYECSSSLKNEKDPKKGCIIL